MSGKREHKESTLVNKPGYGCVYSITNKANGKMYIGQTKKEYVSNRWAEHKWLSKTENSNMEIHKAIKEYGIENFEFEVLLKDVPEENLFEKEQEYIKIYNTFSPFGYNSTLGGAGTCGLSPWDKGINRDESTKKKIRDKWTDERKRWYSERFSGENNPMYGRTGELSPTFGVRKCGKENPFYGKKHSDETRKKISDFQNKNKKKVIMCAKETHDGIMEFESLSSAAQYIRDNTKFKKADDSAIGKSTKEFNKNGRPKVAYGYSWVIAEV